MSSKLDATIEAVKNADTWMGGAVVVKDGRNYEAIPQAHLSDGSYTGSRNIVIDLANGLEDSSGYSLDEATPKDIACLLLG